MPPPFIDTAPPGTPRSATLRTPLLEAGAASRAALRSRRRTWYMLLAVVLAATSWLVRRNEGQLYYALTELVFGEKYGRPETNSKVEINTAPRSGPSRMRGQNVVGSNKAAYHAKPPGLIVGSGSNLNKGLPNYANAKGGPIQPIQADAVLESELAVPPRASMPQPASRFARRAVERQVLLPSTPTCQPDMLLADFTRGNMMNSFGLGWMNEGMVGEPAIQNGSLQFTTSTGKSWILTKLPCSTSDSDGIANDAFFSTYQKYVGISYKLSGPVLGLPYGISVKVCSSSPVLAGQSFYVPLNKGTSDQFATVTFRTLFGNTGSVVPQIEHIAWETLPGSTYSLDDIKLAGTCSSQQNTGRLFDPGMGKFIYGASIDYTNDSPQEYVQRMGDKVQPIIWNCYVVFSDHFPTEPVYQAADPLLQLPYETILAIFAMPQADGGLDALTDEGIKQLAEACKVLNDKGLRVMVVFGHEGNGYWYKYGGQPKKYRDAWKRVSTVVRSIAGEKTAMVWHMNTVIPNYWNTGMQFDPELDTNGNGYIDLQDDPFTPYFPGPEYVDWVAVSYYHYGVEYPWKENYLPESPTKFRDGLDGRMGTNPARFYTMFAERYNLPMAVMETGAAFFVDSDPGPGRLEMSRAWWRQVYGRSLYKELPLLRAIEWFEHFHADEGTDRDYRVTRDPEIVKALLADLPLEMISKPGDGVWTRP